MMKPVPDGITVEPNEIQIEYSIVSDAESTEELPTAQVKTDKFFSSVNAIFLT